ncbi:MAG: signal peptidase II [Anaerolineae bacterium]|nr:signal peptidase II [Anaerolineae bacterium]
MRRPGVERLILPAVALLLLAADQITKSLVVAKMDLGQSMDLASWLAPFFSVTYVTNTGVAFGLFQGVSELFLVIDVVVVVVLLLYYRHLPYGQFWLRLAMGIQMGGALGNLSDRIVRGAVVDFIDLNFWPMRTWPISNLADISIVSGVILLAGAMLWEQWRGQARAEECEA